jgi:serine/threonine-protein kinase
MLTTTAAPDSTLTSLQEATRGRYLLDRELGRGGMGVVYLARDLSLDRPVAIKLLPPAFAAQPELRERFLRETRTAAGLSHPNIVPIHAVEEVGGLVFYVMGYVDGETLSQRVRRAGPLPATEVARVLQECAWALSYAHGRGIVHRDVKPDNILVERGTGRAFLTDFGIARLAGSTMTAAGASLGTPQYMSPEQATGEAVDARSDLYSLGAVGFFALAGHAPFEAPTMQAVLAMQVTKPAPPVASVRPDVPPRLGDAVDRCLRKIPADRWPSAEAFVAAVQAAQGGAAADVAPPVRNFQRIAEMSTFQAVSLLLIFPMLAIARPAAADVMVIMMIGLPFAVLVQLGTRARVLLRQGFTYQDVHAAFAAEVRQKEEEVAAMSAAGMQPTGFQAWRAPLAMMALGVGIIAVTVFVAVRSPHGSALRQAMRFLMPFGGGIFGAGVAMRFANTAGYERRANRVATRLWLGPFGAWFFRFVSRGAPRGGGSAAPATAATADTAALFASLPPALRKRASGARRVAAQLERSAQALQAREYELERAVAEASDARTPTSDPGRAAATRTADPLAERRAALVDELRAEQRSVAERRTAALAALESLRLQLLRLRAGVGRPEDLAQEVETARRLLGAASGT